MTYRGYPPNYRRRHLTTETFVEACREKFGDKFDYSKTVYTRGCDNITYKCPVHGEILTNARSHLRSENGCVKCVNDNNTYTSDEYIAKVKIIHDNFYSYPNLEYIGIKEDIIVTCPHHGDFIITASSHMQGKGCTCCKTTKKVNNKIVSLQTKLGGDYKVLKVIKNEDEVELATILCPIHGEYITRVSNVQAGHSCRKCSTDKVTHSRDDLIKLFTRKFGNNYSYNNFLAKGTSEKGYVTCLYHGDFLVNARSLLSGRGCPYCAQFLAGGYNMTNANRNKDRYLEIPYYLYYIEVVLGGSSFYKLGITKNIRQRFNGIKRETRGSIKILAIGESNLYSCIKAEYLAKKALVDFKYTPDIKFGGYTECFQIYNNEDIYRMNNIILESISNTKEGV